MNSNLKTEYVHAQHELKHKTMDTRSPISCEEIQNTHHLRALVTDAFKNGAIQEPIYATDHVLAYESLARPKDTHQEYSIGELADAYYAIGRAIEFDVLTCSIGLDHARKEEKLPITLNVSVEAILSPVFWEKMEKHFSDNAIKPEQVIFEILEHDIDPNTDISILEQHKEQGFRFALDDISIGQSHENRLIAFKNLVDFVKIDGPLVRAGLGDTQEEFTAQDFENMVATLHKNLPHAQLIAERTRSADEAKTLFAMDIDAVQGKDLRPTDFAYDVDTHTPTNVTPIEPS